MPWEADAFYDQMGMREKIYRSIGSRLAQVLII
jgi:hypothetical protein